MDSENNIITDKIENILLKTTIKGDVIELSNFDENESIKFRFIIKNKKNEVDSNISYQPRGSISRNVEVLRFITSIYLGE